MRRPQLVRRLNADVYLVPDINVLLDAVEDRKDFDFAAADSWFSEATNPGQELLGYILADVESGDSHLRIVMTDKMADTLSRKLRKWGWGEPQIAYYLEVLAWLVETSGGVWVDYDWANTWSGASRLMKQQAEVELTGISHEDVSILLGADAVRCWLKKHKSAIPVVVATSDKDLASVTSWRDVVSTRVQDLLLHVTRTQWDLVETDNGLVWMKRAN